MATESDDIDNINNTKTTSNNSGNNANNTIETSSMNGSGCGSIPRKRGHNIKQSGFANSNSIENITNDEIVSGNKGGRNIGHNLVQQNFYHAPPADRQGMPALTVSTDVNDSLGPLPQKWEKAYTENGESYFIDHNTGTSHWLDPRLSKFQKKSLEDCMDDELPYGWEKIHDPQYGTYFIDHVNRRTQYENPVLEAKRRAERNREQIKQNSFTRNPSELCGERLSTTLLKSSRGLGFTIVGGDDTVDEFLQIKSIVPNGPAWLDGKLETGDILVYVNDTCVLGFTHHEMVNVFQSILPGETVTLEVCRGYPLPFDPNDPNTEVVTTIAVDGLNSDPDKARILMDFNMDGNYNFLDTSDPLLIGGNNNTNGTNGPRQKNPLSKIQNANCSVKSDGSDNYLNESKLLQQNEKPEILNISIVKGAAMGFGFTIADSAYGQKVKKILDSNCCTNLVEGDLLLAINNISVKHMSHSEVVQVLKDCPKGQEAVLKIQRGQLYNGNLSKGGRFRRSGDAARFGNSQKDGRIGLFRSKTPTADLYSTQQKEILPVRPKTPLVDTRSRAKTPSMELMNGSGETTVDAQTSIHQHTNHMNENIGHVDQNKQISADAKSNNSSINNDIPYMDPLPKLVSSLSERLAEASLNQDHRPNNLHYPDQSNLYHQVDHHARKQHFASQPDLNYDVGQIGQDYYHNGYNGGYGEHQLPGNSYNTIYSPPSPLPIMAPVPTYHQDTCYCYECQDYNRHHQEYIMQPQYNMYPTMVHGQNGRIQKRINDYMIDRRKAGFSPLETHAPVPIGQQMQQHPQQPQNGYWKYGVDNNQATTQEYTLSEVTLERQALGFGFRIVGGTEEGSQVTVGHIVPGGSADGDLRIASGDEILSIDGHNVGSHHRVVQLMGEAALRGQVTMILRRKVRHLSNIPMMRTYPYDVIVSRNESEGFGFVISSSSQHYGSTIGKLIPGSPADRCEELKVDDRIIAVNRVDINGMSHGDIVNLIKDSGLHVRLTIGAPKDSQNIGVPLSQSTNIMPLPPPPPSMSMQDSHHHNNVIIGGMNNLNKNEQYFDNYPVTSSHQQHL